MVIFLLFISKIAPILYLLRIRVKRIMKENAVYEKRSTYKRCCWYVHPDVLARFGQEALPVPCQWTYLTSGAHTTRDESTLGSQGSSPIASHSTSNIPSNKRKSGTNQSITKYMKRCGEREQVEYFMLNCSVVILCTHRFWCKNRFLCHLVVIITLVFIMTL